MDGYLTRGRDRTSILIKGQLKIELPRYDDSSVVLSHGYFSYGEHKDPTPFPKILQRSRVASVMP